MSKSIDKEFFEKWKDKKVVMICEDNYAAREFLKELYCYDISYWVLGKSGQSLDKTRWIIFGDMCCRMFEEYNVNGNEFEACKWLQESGFEKLYYEDYLQENKEMINRPDHYVCGKYECKEVMEAVFGDERVGNFYLLNAFKYLWRADKKNGLEDIKKAKKSIEMFLELYEGKEEKTEVTDTDFE